MIARMLQDCLAEDFDHAAHHRDKLKKEMIEMGQLLNKFGEAIDHIDHRKGAGTRM
jgi:hypothetical protein